MYIFPGLECGNCVLQWRYIAGNNWGMCGDGTGAVGCGPQEEFRACSDVSIGKYHSLFVIANTVNPLKFESKYPGSKSDLLFSLISSKSL